MRQAASQGAAGTAATAAAFIAAEGSDFAVGGATLRAILDDNQYHVSRFQRTDGLEPTEKVHVLLTFAGSEAGAGRVTVAAKAVGADGSYRISSLHPQRLNGVCVELVAVAYPD